MKTWFICVAAWCAVAAAQSGSVTGVVSIVSASGAPAESSADAALWLKSDNNAGTRSAPQRFKILQTHRRFEPHMIVVPVGSTIEFPNLDPFFHNVFSLYDGKRFDLGLYESGGSKAVKFDRPGVCYLFCNIHPEMSAVVVVADSMHYAISSRAGEFKIANVPAGRYLLSVWHERAVPPTAGEFPREVIVSSGTVNLPPIRLVDSGQLIVPHKNKFGQDYPPPASPAPLYK